MIQRTLGDARTLLADIAGVTGYPSTSTNFVTSLNRATEELLRTGDYPSIVDRYKVVTQNRMLALPYYLDRIIGVSVDKVGYELRRPWIEFDQYGPGSQEEYTGVDLVLDKEDAPTFFDIPNEDGRTYTLKLDSTGIEVGTERILVKGYDENGDWIRTEESVSGTYIDGIYITIDTTTTQKFTEVTQITKDATKGYLTLTAVDDLAVETVIGEYHPTELNPSYRRYFIPFLTDDVEPTTVRIRARKRYIPMVNDTDQLLIPNVDALENMIIAQTKRKAQKAQEYQTFKSLAINCLVEEANSYNGPAQSPIIKFSKDFAAGDFESLI
jgi:hypothetical protein